MRSTTLNTTIMVLLGVGLLMAESPGTGLVPRSVLANPAGTSASIQLPPAAVSAVAKPDSLGYFYIFAGKGSPKNHFIPSGWMGDFGDLAADDGSHENPKNSPTSFKITYSAKASQGANWAGMYWQDSVDNWGDRPGGFNLSKFKKLTFWARGLRGGEKIASFKVGGISGAAGDTDSATIGPVTLSPTWTKYTIELTGKNLSHIIGGFGWAASRDDNPNGMTFYLDDIRFET
jgi:hypothetical protein